MLSLCVGAAFRFPGFHPVFSVVYSLFFSLALFFAHARLCFQRVYSLYCKTPGVCRPPVFLEDTGAKWGHSARTRTRRGSRSEWAWAHAEARAERRRNITERIATGGAAAFDAKGPSGVRPQPMASRFALRIDALHGEAGQKLHMSSPQRPAGSVAAGRVARTEFPTDGRNIGADSGPGLPGCQGKYHNMLWCPSRAGVGTFDAS
jgi:hypothetical protein